MVKLPPSKPDELSLVGQLELQREWLGGGRRLQYLQGQSPLEQKRLNTFIDCYVNMIGAYLSQTDADPDPAGLPFVVIGSHIHLLNMRDRKKMVLSIRFPEDDNPGEGHYSFLSEMGRQLLMRRNRQYFSISMGGRDEYVMISSIEFKSVQQLDLPPNEAG